MIQHIQNAIDLRRTGLKRKQTNFDRIRGDLRIHQTIHRISIVFEFHRRRFIYTGRLCKFFHFFGHRRNSHERIVIRLIGIIGDKSYHIVRRSEYRFVHFSFFLSFGIIGLTGYDIYRDVFDRTTFGRFIKRLHLVVFGFKLTVAYSDRRIGNRCIRL